MLKTYAYFRKIVEIADYNGNLEISTRVYKYLTCILLPADKSKLSCKYFANKLRSREERKNIQDFHGCRTTVNVWFMSIHRLVVNGVLVVQNSYFAENLIIRSKGKLPFFPLLKQL